MLRGETNPQNAWTAVLSLGVAPDETLGSQGEEAALLNALRYLDMPGCNGDVLNTLPCVCGIDVGWLCTIYLH